MNKVNFVKRACAVLALCAATAISVRAQTFTTVQSFDNTDGGYPFAGLIQGTDGNLYGTTAGGGINGDGTVFKISPAGTLTVLHSFCSESGCTDGDYPETGLVQGSDGNFYGTTVYGGVGQSCTLDVGCGTVFKVTPSGTLTTLYSFCSQSNCADGELPLGGLVQINGNLYGTVCAGGANGAGTVFKITPGGTLSTLHNFCSQSSCADGDDPRTGLIQATDGNLYGATWATVFRITPSGTLTTLHSFDGTDGDGVQGALVQASDGNLYGTTLEGGATGTGCYGVGCGTVFKIDLSGAFTSLYSFCLEAGCPDGYGPYDGLVQATDGMLYGTTYLGGASDAGTIFKITTGGTLTTLHSFDDTDGIALYDGLTQDTNGTLYGTTYAGGASDVGTVFSLCVGLGPFVKTEPVYGAVGKVIKILGTNLAGATSVTFNGTPAVFKVATTSLIGAIVPAGATSGTVQVTTPSGVLSSNVPFRVVQ